MHNVGVALVDDEDFDLVSRFSWRSTMSPSSHTRYAITQTGVSGPGCILMHRLILGIPHGNHWVDHVNGDGLDNQRKNIRACSPAENLRNAKKFNPKASSRFKGVYLDRRVKVKLRKPWKATIQLAPGKQLHLGRHATEEEAALAYDRAAREHFGDFARLNFPDRAVSA